MWQWHKLVAEISYNYLCEKSDVRDLNEIDLKSNRLDRMTSR